MGLEMRNQSQINSPEAERAMLETWGCAGKGCTFPADLVEVSSKIGAATPVGKVQPDA